MQTNYLCTECENIDELSNFIEPVKDGYYYTATCNKCNNRTHILKEHKEIQVTDKNIQTIKVFSFKESGRYYDEFEISVAPEEDSWNSVIKAVKEYRKTAIDDIKPFDWLIGMEQDKTKVSKNVYETIYPIILKG